MDDELSCLNLAEDFQAVLACDDAKRWMLESPEPLTVLATMSSTKLPEEVFQARLSWTKYPNEPPSMKFRDKATSRLDLPAAWPQVRVFRPSSFDACVSWCAEGFALHPEWRNDPQWRWDSSGNVLLKVLRILQAELDSHLQGRFHG